MRGGDGPGEFSERTDPQSPNPLALQQPLAPRGPSVERLQPQVLRVGRDLLPGAARQRQEPCLRAALSGPALAQDPVEDVAEWSVLRRKPSRSQPATTWFVGVAVAAQKDLTM